MQKLLGAVFGIIFALASALLLRYYLDFWPQVWNWLGEPARKDWATIVQLVGALVTAGGLASTYTRASYGLALAKAVFWAVVLGLLLTGEEFKKFQDELRHRIGLRTDVAELAGSVVGVEVFAVDPQIPVEQQVERLAVFANNLAKQLPQMGERLAVLDRSFGEVRAETRSWIGKRFDQVDRAQVLDLRWAIFGLVISAAGTALSYGT
ncbi:hypothetical protein [Mycobacterium sp. AZCC_0083]|uniref:hypothetical protein n=1 Tax=Mycobacterium sp. AZCC_0083 TaxID=2735882 RepID=UPI0016149B13|nr:hypothetical protein [Mycobacterium sp. AZCC_0083]MBB5168375.1 hypothetical protein [Mycobacterium sp. AZCC_0083]